MQELIDWLDPSFSSVIDKAKELLEKGKQQICTDWSAGLNTERRGNNPNANLTGEDYFADTYKQSKQ